MLLCAAGTVSTVRAQKVTLNFRDAKLEQVFGRITEQTGYTFYYARPTVNPDKIVSIAVKDGAEATAGGRQGRDRDP